MSIFTKMFEFVIIMLQNCRPDDTEKAISFGGLALVDWLESMARI
jgi:hypothetical protein